jgi:hypothetical protein
MASLIVCRKATDILTLGVHQNTTCINNLVSVTKATCNWSLGICHKTTCIQSLGICHKTACIQSLGVCHTTTCIQSLGVCHKTTCIQSLGVLHKTACIQSLGVCHKTTCIQSLGVCRKAAGILLRGVWCKNIRYNIPIITLVVVWSDGLSPHEKLGHPRASPRVTFLFPGRQTVGSHSNKGDNCIRTRKYKQNWQTTELFVQDKFQAK